jgi:hypothetical protein
MSEPELSDPELSEPELSKAELGKPEKRPAPPAIDSDDLPSEGPNLVVLYSLIALALAVAIGFALMIVMPFYHRH